MCMRKCMPGCAGTSKMSRWFMSTPCNAFRCVVAVAAAKVVDVLADPERVSRQPAEARDHPSHAARAADVRLRVPASRQVLLGVGYSDVPHSVAPLLCSPRCLALGKSLVSV